MKKYKEHKIISLIGGVALLMLVVWRKFGVVGSASIDLSHHYALIHRIAEYGLSPPVPDSALGDMILYPNWSHVIAAFFGSALGSNFLGMHLTSYISIVLIWMLIFFSINTLPKKVASLSLLLLLILFAVNGFIFHLDIHGAEIIRNYFYAQQIAQAILFACLACLVVAEQKKSNYMKYLMLTFFICCLEFFHLLPCLILLGCMGVLIAIDFLSDFLNKRIMPRRHLFAMSCFFTASFIVYKNPLLSIMVSMSENNGSLDLKHIHFPNGFILMSLVGASLAACMIFIWYKSKCDRLFSVLRIFGAYGLAVSVMCLTQLFLLHKGVGSEYAVKKYGIALNTFILISIALVLAIYFEKKFFSKDVFNEILPRPLHLVIFILPFVLFLTLPKSKILDTQSVVRFERELGELYLKRGLGNTLIIDLTGMPREVNYMFSISIAKTKRSNALSDLMDKNEITDLKNYDHIIMSKESHRFNRPDCKDGFKRFVIYNSDCLMKEVVE